MDIWDYRRKLDKTLASPDLMNNGKLQTLVRNQILQSSHDLHFQGDIENVVERRSKEVSNVLSMLRTASLSEIHSSKSTNAAWKVKEESDEFRVMYREGAEGTPFHTLLVEGYVDGPLDVCVFRGRRGCTTNGCLKRVRRGEQISLVRMKVSWPLSSREAVLHYFAFEYLQDDLIVVLFNSISDSESIDRRSHGFTRDGIPNADELVRIDVVGGFACQKVTANRCYFRVIASLDVKLDMVPPSFINFISRQLLGTGFKLFKKEVASVCAGDENFREALSDPFYTRIREGLDSRNSSTRTSIRVEDQSETAIEDTLMLNELKPEKEAIDIIHPTFKSSPISPEVERALQILEKVNSIVRDKATNLDELITEGDRKCGQVDESRVKESISCTREIKITNSSMKQSTSKLGKIASRLKNIKIKLRFCCLRIISS